MLQTFMEFSPVNPQPTSVDTVVIGAGLSGLVAARRAVAKGHTVRLLEQAGRAGGLIGTRFIPDTANIHTCDPAGYWVETGPHSFPASAQAVLALCDELGLTPQVLNAKQRYLALSQERLTLAPSGPLSALTTPLLSPWAKVRLLSEPFQPASLQLEPTVAQFVAERFGPEVLDNLVAPLLTGIYAGDVDQLSATAVMPRLVHWANAHGSVVKGALHALRHNPPTPRTPAAYPKHAVLGFPNGMQTVVNVLVNALPDNVLSLNTHIDRLQHSPDGWRILLNDGSVVTARQVVLACTAPETARLLAPHAAYLPAVQALKAIPFSPVTMLHLGMARSAVKHALNGFGFLAAPKSRLPILGCIFASTLFPNRAPKDHVLLTVLLGGTLQPDLTTLPDDQLIPLVWSALTPLLGLGSMAQLAMAHRIDWPQAIPQLTLGHPQRWEAIQQTQDNNLHIVGNFGKGIALNPLVEWANLV
jgi:protoporphyrinogen/coproporphyrinogen III oxidase